MARISALPEIVPAGRVDRAAAAPEREQRAFGDRAELTAREREVLALVAQGLSDRGIAKRLWLTRNTVETHIRHILGKLNLPNDAHHNRRVLAVLIYLREPDQAARRPVVGKPCRVEHAISGAARALDATGHSAIVDDRQWPTSGLTLVRDGD